MGLEAMLEGRLRAKAPEPQGLGEAGKSPRWELSPFNTFISDFWPLELRK